MSESILNEKKIEEINEKVNKALKQANEAMKEMGENTKVALSEDYDILKEAYGKTNTSQSILDAKNCTIEKAKELGNKFIDAKDEHIAKAKEFGAQMDEDVKAKPYHYIAGASVLALLVGILLGRKN